ncbi:putative phospholipid ABC transporter-binding protein MlaD [bacterium BMS3Bbin06]|nr:putative phospholipid ABC transporter-binding protein MlaD [bacterium BMS3Abin08]GBE34235.1 putative phospholipid ABC transporter-binding protein MlaD [bacterium BMS3Bbin06]HDO36905.1 outer membrane lipid asymmetry maintenance protein MlaD [Nitrospirota bacterium]HDY71984.1 outer membrane lipid asymmetry maintenance protein MlaD [Nitrospirota bacterium]
MKKRFNIEVMVGFFVLIGILSLAYLSIRLGRLEVIGSKGYVVYAAFDRAGGIKPGSVVEIAGVEVGKVKSVVLDKDYQALVGIQLHRDVKIQEDAIASIKTKGLIGEKYIQITPGGSEKLIAKGGKIRDTESAIDIEDLISSYVFGKVQ